jgi:hypothetical protein
MTEQNNLCLLIIEQSRLKFFCDIERRKDSIHIMLKRQYG